MPRSLDNLRRKRPAPVAFCYYSLPWQPSALLKILVLFSLSLFLASKADAESPHYRLTDLGTLPGADSSAAFGINGQGNVGGMASHLVLCSIPLHPFLYRNGQMRDLGLLHGMTGGCALSVNQKGEVVGEMHRLTTSDPYRHCAFIWRNGILTGLDVPKGSVDSEAKGINDNDQVVGSIMDAKSRSMAFLWQGGRMRQLGILRGFVSIFATAINNQGQIAGYVEASPDTGEPAQAFFYNNGKMRGLGRLGGNHSRAYALNDDGQVVGESATDRHDAHGNVITHPFLWKRGSKMIDLGSLGGTYGEAYGINRQGQVVGTATGSDDHDHAFLWQRRTLSDLNTLIPPGSGWFLSEAHAINDRGQIVGTGVVNGHERAFLLTPITK